MRVILPAIKIVADVTKDYCTYKSYGNIYRNTLNSDQNDAYNKYLAISENLLRDSWRLINFQRNIQPKTSTLNFSPKDFNIYSVC